ncbi:glucose 1-dehydrogenase [Dongia deserti]|uniref:glucose 1-dehydrogenase n=1 Tax=Dongia deserti TaxID=2268030 RepID=UPI000E64C0C3|nr:glucose 1-dehydrogenase [Dongia deserti]
MDIDPRQLLLGQTALITGASSGIGEAIARRFAAAGAAVGINYHSKPDAAEQIAKDLSSQGGQAIALKADVSREDEVRAMVAAFVAAFGRIDTLVANAGIQMDAAIGEMSLEQWQRVLAVNLTGQFLCAREAIWQFEMQEPTPHSRARGKIICMSSVHEAIPWAGHVNYAASKGGVLLMMKTLAQELAGKRIRVNGIAPGAIRTEINRATWETPEAEAALLRLIPYGRIGERADVAEAALWLASDLSDYVTGTTLFIDGGMALYPAFRAGG